MPNVTTSTHPLLQKTHQDEFYEGMSIAQIVELSAKKYKMGPWFRKNIYVELDGTPVTKENWSKIFPNAGQHIAIKFNVPMGGGGGGGKNIIKAVAMVIVAVVAAWTGQWYAYGYLGMTGAGAAAVAAGTAGVITTAGALTVNALVPNKPLSATGVTDGYGDTAESKIYTISGMQNQERPYGALPVVLGRVRFAPYFGAKSYTEIRGNDQYLHAALLWGYGPLMVSDIKNGDTDFTEYTEVQVKTNQGWETDTELDLYPQDIYENYISSVLKYNNPVIRTSVQEVNDISIDLVFSKGLTHMTDQGTRAKRSVSFSIEWKKTDETVYNELLVGAVNPASYTSSPISVFNAMVVCAYLDRSNMQVKFATKFHERASSDYWFGTIGLDPWLPDTIAVYKFSASPNVSENAVGRTFIVDGYSGFTPSVSIDRWMTSRGMLGTNHARMTLNIGRGTYLGDRFKRFTITGATSQPLLRTVQLPISEKGQYDVKITRLTEEPGASNTRDYDECTWAVLRNIKNEDPIQFPVPVAETQLVVKATDQLNGNLKQLNGIVSSVCLDYDSESDEWIMQETNNPASLLRHVLQSPANASAVPDNQIDLETLEEFHIFCTEEGFTYNRVIDGQTSVWSLLTEIAAAGRSAISIIDNKWTVIIDRKRTDGPVQMFTPSNSWGFKSNKTFVDDLHGYRCQFNNEEKQYQEDEVYVYAEGYNANNASKFEAMEFAGVTDVKQIQNLARYNLAVRKYRPELFTWNADFESMVCARGDLVTVSHYVIQVGFNSGRIREVSQDNLTITLDQEVVLSPDKEYGIRVRNVSDSAKIDTLKISSVAEVTNTNIITVFADINNPTISTGDLFTFGELGKESIDVIITGKIPNSDMSATITGVQYSWNEISAYLEGEFPPYYSGISRNIYDTNRPVPPIPIIVSATSDESVMALNQDGSINIRMFIIISVPSSKHIPDTIEYGYSTDGGVTWNTSYNPNITSPIIINNLNDNDIVDVRVRSQRFGVYSEYAFGTFRVYGKTSLPPDIGTISYANGRVTWTLDTPPIDIDGFIIKTSRLQYPSWETAVREAHLGKNTYEYKLEDATGLLTIMIKALDVAGNESRNFASVVINAGDLPVDNVLLELPQHPKWEGDLTGGYIENGIIKPYDNSKTFGPLDSLTFKPETNLFLETLTSTIEYKFSLAVEPVFVGNNIVLDVESGSKYEILFRTIHYDQSGNFFIPTSDLTFEPQSDYFICEYKESDWLPWTGKLENVQDVTYYEFKIIVEGGTNFGLQGLSKCTVIIDVPDINEVITDYEVPAGGIRLPISKTYNSIRVVNLTLENADEDNAVSVKIKDKSITGPYVVVYDSNGNTVDGIVTAQLQGY